MLGSRVGPMGWMFGSRVGCLVHELNPWFLSWNAWVSDLKAGFKCI